MTHIEFAGFEREVPKTYKTKKAGSYLDVFRQVKFLNVGDELLYKAENFDSFQLMGRVYTYGRVVGKRFSSQKQGNRNYKITRIE
jgi:hypothetical protein